MSKYVTLDNLTTFVSRLKDTFKPTVDTLGCIKASNVLNNAVTLTSANGATASRYYGVQVDKDGKAFVNIPWTDQNLFAQQMDDNTAYHLLTTNSSAANSTSWSGTARYAKDILTYIKATKTLKGVAKLPDLTSMRGVITEESLVRWGGGGVWNQSVSPIDMGYDGQWSANRLSFMPAKFITVDYSTDGGANWTDYGLSEDGKRSLVTTGLSQTIYCGKKSASQIPASDTNIASGTGDMVRVTIDAPKSVTDALYLSLRKIFVHMSRNNAVDAKMKLEYLPGSSTDSLTNHESEWKTAATYTIDGWHGWNSIPWSSLTLSGVTSGIQYFGGGYVRAIRMTFYHIGNTSTASMYIDNIAFHADMLWSSGSTVGSLPQTGHMYTWDINKNVTFPANVILGGTTSDKPSLIFKRGTYTDTAIDWRIINEPNYLRFQSRHNSEDWVDVMSLKRNGTYKQLSVNQDLYVNNAIYLDGTNILDQFYNANIDRTANTVLAAPNGSNGSATFRKLVSADLPIASSTDAGVVKIGYTESSSLPTVERCDGGSSRAIKMDSNNKAYVDLYDELITESVNINHLAPKAGFRMIHINPITQDTTQYGLTFPLPVVNQGSIQYNKYGLIFKTGADTTKIYGTNVVCNQRFSISTNISLDPNTMYEITATQMAGMSGDTYKLKDWQTGSVSTGTNVLFLNINKLC